MHGTKFKKDETFKKCAKIESQPVKLTLEDGEVERVVRKVNKLEVIDPSIKTFCVTSDCNLKEEEKFGDLVKKAKILTARDWCFQSHSPREPSLKVEKRQHQVNHAEDILNFKSPQR